MELPVIHTDPAGEPGHLIRTVKRVLADLACCSAEPVELAVGRAFARPDRPDADLVNWTFDLRLPDHVDAARVLDDVQAHYASVGGRCRGVVSTDVDFDAELIAELTRRGWRARPVDVLVLKTLTIPSGWNEQVQVLPARAVIEQYQLLYEQVGPTPADCAVEQLDEARLDSFVARVDRKVVSEASVVSVGDVGVIRSVIERPEVVGRGIADRLLVDLFGLCGRAQFRAVCAPVEPGEDYKRTLLERFGMVRCGGFAVYEPGTVV